MIQASNKSYSQNMYLVGVKLRFETCRKSIRVVVK